MKIRKSQKGVSMAEAMIATPFLLLLGLSTIEMGFIWQAKSAIDYAAFMAARAGAMSGLDIVEMRCAALKAVYSFRVTNNGSAEEECNATERLDVRQENLIVYVTNPTLDAFRDFGYTASGARCTYGQAGCEIPNTSLSYRATTLGATSRVNVQDANLVRVQVVYGYNPWMPFVRNMLLNDSIGCLFNNACTRDADGSGEGILEEELTGHPFLQRDKTEQRLPLVGYGTVRAQTPLRTSTEFLIDSPFPGAILSRCQVANLIVRGGLPPSRGGCTLPAGPL